MDEVQPACLRWAVDVSRWQPEGGSDGQEWCFLEALLSAEERAKARRFVRLDDRKRSLVSALLQRASCARVHGARLQDVELRRTKGGKPFLAGGASRDARPSPPAQPAAPLAAQRPPRAPNWNFNVSHEGDFVVLASEPLAVCGVDVAAPAQLRRGGGPPPPMAECVRTFARQLTAGETEFILGAGSEGALRDAAAHSLLSSHPRFQPSSRTPSRECGAARRHS